jgi:hypothetical protein
MTYHLPKSGGKSRRKSRARRTMKGGEGAAEWGVKAYGGIDAQKAMTVGDNKIAMTGGEGEMEGDYKKVGGTLIGELAAPAILLVAQQKYGSRRSSKKFRKNRKSRSYRRR